MSKILISFIFLISVQNLKAQWTLKYQTTSNENIKVSSSPDSNTFWFITNFDRLYRTTDGGTVWNLIPHTGSAFVPSGLFVVNRDTAFKTGSASVFRTIDGGNQWDLVFSNSGNEIPAVSTKNNSEGVLSFGGLLYKTTDGGNSWSTLGITQPPHAVVNSSGKGTVYGYDNNLWVAENGSGISYSSDYGNNWNLPSNSGLTFSGPSNIFFGSPLFGISVKRNSSFVYITKNGGNNWIPADNSLGLNEDVAIINSHCWYIPDPFDHFYIKYSADSGAAWTIQLTDPAGFSVLEKSRSGNTLWAGTTTGKVYKYNDPVITSVSSSDQNTSEFMLKQNYPNPFNPKTEISYEVPAVKSVKLTVYNILGKEMAELVNERQSPGKYKVSFDASDLTSGVYIYKLSTENFTETKRMILIK